MKTITYDEPVKALSMTLDAEPLSIWPSRNFQILIERGDTVKQVAAQLEKFFKGFLSAEETRKMVAFYFALGERRGTARAAAPWDKRELRADPTRRYSPVTKRGSSAGRKPKVKLPASRRGRSRS